MTLARECWNIRNQKPDLKWKRTTHAKVRTGCNTCKSRRVKCDEGKPFCARCGRAGIKCDGYPTPAAETEASHYAHPQSVTGAKQRASTGSATLKPKQLRREIICAAVSTANSSGTPWLSASMSPVVLSGQDVAYLDAFRYHIVDDFNAWLPPGFWDGIVLRESMHDEAIRHSILGLAAMARVGRFTTEQAEKVVGEPNTAFDYDHLNDVVGLSSEHHQAALSHYTQAIAACRKTLLASGAADAEAHDLKRVLISMVIFVIIEMMQGNIQGAINLVSNGVRLIHSSSQKTSAGQQDAELALTEAIFHRFSIIGGLRPDMPSSRDAHPGATSPKIAMIPSPSDPVGAVLDQWSVSFRPLQPFIFKSAFGHAIGDEELDEYILKLPYNDNDLGHWRSLIGYHLRRCRDNRVRRSLLLIKVQILMARIHLAYCTARTDSAYDEHTKDFAEIVQLADKFTATDLAGCLRFTVDFNLFPWLSFTIAKCRDRIVRQSAMETFIRLVFRHCGWGNIGLIKALRAVVYIEDQWPVGDGGMRDSVKYSWSLSRWDLERRKIWVWLDPIAIDSSRGDDHIMPVREIMIDY